MARWRAIDPSRPGLSIFLMDGPHKNRWEIITQDDHDIDLYKNDRHVGTFKKIEYAKYCAEFIERGGPMPRNFRGTRGKSVR